MISKMRSMAFVLLLIMLFSGVVNGRSEDMVTDMRIDRWFTNLFYPSVYDPFDIDHAVPGSTKWYDYKSGIGTPVISSVGWSNFRDKYDKRLDVPRVEPPASFGVEAWLLTPEERAANQAYIDSLKAGVGTLY